ncbi:preprotein translocase subunit SecY [Phyllobacterium sp. K27]
MNFDSLSHAKPANSLWQAVTPLVLAVVVVLVGSRIPLPGIDAAALVEQLAYSSNGAMARFSIFALGIIPFFTVLAYAEIAKLVFPPLARWQAVSSGNTFRMSVVIKSIVLLLTAIQGYGILSALAAMELVDGSPRVMVAGIASFVGASVVMIWLADMVRLPNLGNGVWLLLAIPLLGALPGEFVASFELTRFGAVSVVDWLITVIAIVLAIAMIVVANRLLSRKHGEAGPTLSLAVLLWPPFLANTLAGYLIAVPFVLLPELLSGAPWLLNVVALALSATLIPLFVYAYHRLISIVRPDIARGDIRSILMVVAGIQILVCAGLGMLKLATSFSFVPSGGMLIVCVTVLLALEWSPDGHSGVGS